MVWQNPNGEYQYNGTGSQYGLADGTSMNSGRYGEVTRGKRKGIKFIIKVL